MNKLALIMGAASLAFGVSSVSAGELDGNWTTTSGATVQFYPGCGTYCGKLVGGKFNGKVILRISGGSGKYSGKIIDPDDNDKEYRGHLLLQGPKKMRLKGCALRIFCRTQYWTKQG
ncbi:MAG: DUF2147 domain-containing protein [Pseudomonadota bacterium]